MNFLSKIFHVLSGKRASQNKDIFKDAVWTPFYDAAVPSVFHPTNDTLLDLLEEAVEHYPDHAFLNYFGKKISFQEFYELIRRTAFSFQKMGVKKNDRVAILLPNTPDFVISYWAALYIGAIAVPVSPFLSSCEIKTFVDLVKPKIFIVLDLLVPRSKQAIESSTLNYVVITNVRTFMPRFYKVVSSVRSGFTKNKLSKTIVPFKHLFHAPVMWEKIKHSSSDNAVMLLTGGTTGTPKAVLLSHKNLVANTMQSRIWIHSIQDGQENMLAVLPFCHSYGMTSCHHLAVLTKSTLIIEPRFNASRIVALAKKHGITYFPGVPTMYKAVSDYLSAKAVKLKGIKVCISGGAPLPVKIKQEFESLTGSTLVEGYGLTEAAPITHCNPIGRKHKTGSIGLPLPGTQARIINGQDGKSIGYNEPGELYVRGPQVMQGYWNSFTETHAVLSADGWLATGDIAKMDKDGYFYIVDRKKDIILNGGLNVYPSTIEAVINKHPDVRECTAVGKPDDFYGEVVKLFVVVKSDAKLSSAEILQFCKNKLAAYEMPKEIEFVTTLPKNFLGKVLRRQLVKKRGQSNECK